MNFKLNLDDSYNIFKKRKPSVIEFIVIPKGSKKSLIVRYSVVYKKIYLTVLNRATNEKILFEKMKNVTEQYIRNICKTHL